MNDTRLRYRPVALAEGQTTARIRVEAAGDSATIYVYDVIDSWGGEFGVSASELRDALAAVTGSTLALHINSPGGDYFEAVAMRALLTAHAATVTVYIDGMAASAASVLATVGDKVIMAPGSKLMIHEASSVAFGNSADMQAGAKMLDSIGDDIAAFYSEAATKRGVSKTPEQFRDAMRVETWYSPAEAIAAGLADEVAGAPSEAEPEPDRLASAWARYAQTPAVPTAVAPTPASHPLAGLDIAALVRSGVRRDTV